LVHVDAVQGAGRLALDFEQLNADLLSLSAHKMRGPKGVGALIVRKGLELSSVTTGGNQERGMRSGTENTVGIVGFGRAAELALEGLKTLPETWVRRRDTFESEVLASIDGARIHGLDQPRLPTVTNIGFDDLEGEAALLALDMQGICASSGSACASGSLEPSHVLLAMGYSPEQAHGSIRFSLGVGIESADLAKVVAVLRDQVPKLRALLIDPLI